MKAAIVWPAAVALGPITYGAMALLGYWGLMAVCFIVAMIGGIWFDKRHDN
jgi:hypothetical protein